MQLVIVESPTKAKTISKFLGKDYIVKSSFGHVRDLPKSNMGIDIEHGFTPEYKIPAKAKVVIQELKDAYSKCDGIILASDEDREGEAIAWHLAEALGLNKEKKGKKDEKSLKTQRIVFHEITKSAIEHAINNPREINMNLVDAQQARRILDRLVGYELSPFLWRKVRYGLSAGRVQSVTVRLVVEREREIEAFKTQEYWSINADFFSNKEKDSKFRATLIKIGNEKLDKFAIKDGSQANKIVTGLSNATYTITDIQKKEARRNPAPPFTTSTLQQEASRKLGMSAKQTMMHAQRLYETGLITYMRTDSVNLSKTALDQSKEAIIKMFGKQYALEEPRFYTNKSKGAQEAHEAIRPTHLLNTASDISVADDGQRKLYDLIWKRTLATQMQQAIFDQTSIDITAQAGKNDMAHIFRATGQIIKFDGFIKVYTEGKDIEDDEDKEGVLPPLNNGDALDLAELIPLQHFTEPPPRYTDATLVKALEAHGIGRPSTYAPTLSTVQERGYIEKIEKKYHPTEVGILVNDILVEHFPEIVDINFTSHVEEELDDIAEGKLSWTSVVKEFYQPFKKNLINKEKTVEKIEEESDVECEHCGKKMMLKFGRNGKFLACPDPESKITKPLPEEEQQLNALGEKTKDEKCPECQGQMKVRKGRFGYFLGCMNYPKCKGIAKIVTRIGYKCPNCGKGDMIERKSRGRGKLFYGCMRYPDCTFLTSKLPESQEELNSMLEEWKNKPKKKPKTYQKKDINSKN